MENHPHRRARRSLIRRRGRKSRGKSRLRQPAPWPARPPSCCASGTRPSAEMASISTCSRWTWTGSCLRTNAPPAPPTGPRTCGCQWPSWKGRSLFHGVPAAPPPPSSALGNVSSPGWCRAFGQDPLAHPRKSASP